MKIHTITAFTNCSNFNKLNSKITFGEATGAEDSRFKSASSQKSHEHSCPNCSHKNKKNNTDSLLGGFTLASAIAILLAGVNQNKFDKSRTEFIENTTNLIESGVVKTNEFAVKDVTDDGQPDFILTKQDSTKVVLDLYNLRILEEKSK